MAQRKGKKSYFRVLFKNLLLAFIIPVLVATTIIAVFQARQDLQQTDENLEVSVQCLAAMLEAQIGCAQRVAYHCVNDSFMVSLAREPYDILTFAPLTDALVRLKMTATYLDDIILCYDHAPMVYTTEGIYPVRESVTSLLIGGLQPDRFLADTTRYFTFTRARVSRAGQVRDSLIYAYRDQIHPGIRILVTFQPRMLGYASKSEAADEWLVLSKEGDTLLSSLPVETPLLAAAEREGRRVTAGNSSYYATRLEMADYGLTLVTMKAVADVQAYMIRSVATVLLMSLLVMALAMVVIFRITSRAYAPVGALYQATGIQQPQPQTDEFSQISSAISAMRDDISQKEQSLQNQRPAVHMQLLSQLINGMFATVEDFQYAAARCGVTLRWRHFVVFMTAGEFTSEPVLRFVEQEFGELADVFGSPTMIPGRQMFVLSVRSPEKAESCLRNLHAFLLGQFAPVTVYVSGQVQHFSRISQAAAECQNLIAMYGENGQINFFHADIRESEMLVRISGNSYPHLKSLQRAVWDVNLEEANQCLDRLEKEFDRLEMTPYVAQCISYELINSVVRAAQELLNQQEIEANTKKLELLDQLYGRRNLSETMKMVRNMLARVLTPTQPSAQKRGHREIDEILAYIQQNYRKYEFSVKQVAEYAELSLPGLSNYFKAQQGITVVDYVLQLRIEAAKELLVTTDLLVADIVNEIGYVSVPSFVNKFKKVTGMTPGEYRGLMIAKEENGI